MQDFFQGEYRIDPVPDNVLALTKTNPVFTLTGIERFQANDFFTTTERQPEVVLDIKRHGLFGGPIFYEGETGFANLRLQFPEDSGLKNYGTDRFDTFHELIYPNTYFGWLSIVPRVGYRGTYYGKTWDLGSTVFVPPSNPLVPNFILPPPTTANPIKFDGDTFRSVFDTGAEASFKISRAWENVQSRAPFTRYQHDDGPGEVSEAARGRGLRRAVGELLVCPYCIGMWISAAFAAGLLVAPRFTRWFAAVLVALFGADVLQIAYRKAEDAL